MSVYTVDMQSGTDLPPAVEAPKDGVEAKLANFFTLPDDEIKKPKAPKPPWQKSLNSVVAYFSGQLALWGFLLFPLLALLFKRHRSAPVWPKPELKALAWASAIVPLGVFALLSPFQFIEANWPAMYLVGASVVIAQHYRGSDRVLFGAALVNLLVTLLLTVHNYQPLPGTKPHKDRILKETHGYKDLSVFLRNLPAPILVDTYQNASQLAFYQPELKIQQWPGVARTSELIRRKELNPWRWEDLRKAGEFYILMDNFVPKRIPGADLVELTELLDCYGEGIKATVAFSSSVYTRPCAKRIHRWVLGRYKFNAALP